MSENIIGFYSKSDEYGWLSNFYRAKQTIHDITYQTNEHYYQSCKAENPVTREWIANAPFPYQAMMAGRSLRPNEMVNNWERDKKLVMRFGLRMKFTQNEDLKEKLLATGDATLFEDSPTDMYWGGKLPDSRNMLGILLMELRSDLAKEAKKEGLR